MPALWFGLGDSYVAIPHNHAIRWFHCSVFRLRFDGTASRWRYGGRGSFGSWVPLVSHLRSGKGLVSLLKVDGGDFLVIHCTAPLIISIKRTSPPQIKMLFEGRSCVQGPS